MRARAARARGVAAAIAAAALLALAGCAGKSPVITRVFAQPIFVHDRESGSDYVRLGVFLVASDPDGQDDLATLYVINDSAELYWKAESGDWASATAEGEPWIGTSTFSLPGSSVPPAGEYRVVLQDQAGETAESAFTLPKLDFPPASAYPSASIAGDTITVAGAAEVTQLWAAGTAGKQAVRVPVPKGSARVPAAQLRQSGAPSGSSFWVYTLDRSKLYGLLAGPYRLP